MTIEEYLKNKNYSNEVIVKIKGIHALRYYLDDTLILKVKSLESLFMKIGFNQGEIIQIISFVPEIIGYDTSTIITKIEALIKFAGSISCAKGMIKNNPRILSYSKENIDQKIKDLMSFGYDRQAVITIIKKSSRILSFSKNTIQEKFEFLIGLGYTSKNIIKMTQKFMDLFYFSLDNIGKKFEDLIKIGYTKEDIIKMTIKVPEIYSYKIDSIINKIEQIMLMGYSKEDVIKMTIELPSLISSSLETIKMKLDFYGEIGFKEVIKNKPKNLIQSLEVSYARYMFYTKNGILIDAPNYRRLFVGQDYFEHTFKIDKKTLLKMYPLDMEKRKNGRII